MPVVEIWQAMGTLSGDDVVIAELAGSPANAVIAVTRYSGVDPSTPLEKMAAGNTLGLDGACKGDTDSDAYSFDVSTAVDGALLFGAAALRNRRHSPGAAFTERGEFVQDGGRGGDKATLAIQDRLIEFPGSATLDGTFWRSTMIDMDSRLRVARGFGKTETLASIEVFKTLKRRSHPDLPPPTISDGWGGIDDAMIEVYGRIPPYSGRGRPPTHKRAEPGWKYVQMVKQRDEHGRFLGTELRVIYGNQQEVLELLGISTAYIERTHLTMRHFNSRLTRKSLAFSKELQMHKAAAVWEDLYYNMARKRNMVLFL